MARSNLKKKKPAALPAAKTSPSPSKKARHRVAVQITISPEMHDFLVEVSDRFGPGTRSVVCDMCFRHAQKTGLFDSNGAITVTEQPRPFSLDVAIQEALPNLIARMIDSATKNNGGS
jgi:hypothetical protein